MLKAVNILNYLKKRTEDNWLVNYDSQAFYRLTLKLFGQLEEVKKQVKQPKIILSESDSIYLLACFLAAVAANCPVFLANPDWGKQEFETVIKLVEPELVFTKKRLSLREKIKIQDGQNFYDNLIVIPTGGTSGKIRYATHTWETLTASVSGFSDYFSLQYVNSFCTLPLYHVSGLMQFVRSFITGGTVLLWEPKRWKEVVTIVPKHRGYFISLVPTQLQFMLNTNPHYLSYFSTILVGGAPASLPLLDTARQYHLPLAPTYGMTETASQIVTLKPEEFLMGNNTVGRVLPHAQVIIDNNETPGIIKIKSESLFLGYYPDFNHNQEFIADDLGYFDGEGYLHIVGRNSQKIISGGENIFPTEIEEAILATHLVNDVCIIGLPDPYWGEIIAAVYVAKDEKITTEMIKNALAGNISRYKCPKSWLPLKKIPRNLQGKVNYQEIISGL
jgi:O-succinylbenzoic acid--CoA ligase